MEQQLGLLVASGGAGFAIGLAAGIAVVRRKLARVRAEALAVRERLQTLLRRSGVGLCLCDPATGRFLSTNDALGLFFGRSEAELLQCTLEQLTHPEDQARDRGLAEQLQRGECETYHVRKRFLRPDRSQVWGDLVMACTRHSDGRVRELIAQVTDVSELVAQSAYLEAAASAGVVGVWDWNITEDVLTWDAVMYQLYGLRAEDFSGTRDAWASAVHPDDQAFVLQELQAAQMGWHEYKPRFRVVWPDGSIHHVQARSRTSFGPDGRAQRMIGVNYDITEQVERQLEVEQQRQLLATTLNALVDPLLFLTLEADGLGLPELRFSALNPAGETLFGRSQPQLVGQRLDLVVPAAWNGPVHDALLAVAQGGAPWLADEQPLVLGEGAEPLHVDVRAVAVATGVVVSLRDVSERRRAIRNLAASEERFRLLAENVTDVVFLSEDGAITWMAPSLLEALGWRSEQWLGHHLVDFCHPEDQALARRQEARVEAGEQAIFRVRARDHQNRWHWLEVHAGPNRNRQGALQGSVAVFRVVDADVAAEAELDRRARTDPLTGLFNRQEIFERLEGLARGRRQGDSALAVLFCDIDHFKAINDHHGHAGGDAVLWSLAQRLKQCTRREDLVGRIGGDELLVVLQTVPSLQEAEEIAAKIHQATREPLTLASGVVSPTLSIGVTLIKPDELVERVVERADQAMYEAKQRGRDRVVTFT